MVESASGFWPTDCAYNKFSNEFICSREILLFCLVIGFHPETENAVVDSVLSVGSVKVGPAVDPVNSVAYEFDTAVD